MLSDPIQKKLREMEKENPSAHNYQRGILKDLEDRLYFFTRYLSCSVERVPNLLIMGIGPTGFEGRMNAGLVRLIGFPLYEEDGQFYTALAK